MRPCLCFIHQGEVNHIRTAGSTRQVLAIHVSTNHELRSGIRSEDCLRLIRLEHEASTDESHTLQTHPSIRQELGRSRAADVCCGRQVWVQRLNSNGPNHRTRIVHLNQLRNSSCLRQNSHGHPDGSALRIVCPRVICDGPNDTSATLRRLTDEYAVVDLSNRIRCDEPRAHGQAARDCVSTSVPPVHDIVGIVGHIGIRRSESLDIAVAQLQTLTAAAQVRRIPNDEIRVRPLRRPRVHVLHVGKRRLGVRHQLARHGMRDTRRGVGSVARGVVADLVPCQHRIAALQRAGVLKNRLGRLDVMVRPPELVEPDPQHKLGDLARPQLDLDSVELPRSHLRQPDLVFPCDLFQSADHLELDPLYDVHRHVEEVPGAARRVEELQPLEPVMECTQRLLGRFHVPGFAAAARLPAPPPTARVVAPRRSAGRPAPRTPSA